MGFPNRQTFDAINLCSNNNTIQKNTINEAFAGILEGSGRQHLQSKYVLQRHLREASRRFLSRHRSRHPPIPCGSHYLVKGGGAREVRPKQVELHPY